MLWEIKRYPCLFVICSCLQYILKNLIVISGRIVYLYLFPFPKTFNLCSLGKMFSILSLAISSTLKPEQKAKRRKHLYFKHVSSLIIFKNNCLEIIVGIFLFNLVDGKISLFNWRLKQTEYKNLTEQIPTFKLVEHLPKSIYCFLK